MFTTSRLFNYPGNYEPYAECVLGIIKCVSFLHNFSSKIFFTSGYYILDMRRNSCRSSDKIVVNLLRSKWKLYRLHKFFLKFSNFKVHYISAFLDLFRVYRRTDYWSELNRHFAGSRTRVKRVRRTKGKKGNRDKKPRRK